MARNERTAPDDKPTHLLVQSRRDRFRRAGIEATKIPTAIPLSSLTAEQLKAIEAQGDEIISRRITEREAESLANGRLLDDDDKVSKVELRQLLASRDERIAMLEAENSAYKQAMTGDRPPKQGAPVTGAQSPLPNPGDAGKNPLPTV